MPVCRGGAGGELCQMLLGNLEGWMASVCIILPILYASLSMISCVSCERCFLNPCCGSWSMLCVSRCCMILLVIMCSGILQVMDVSDIGG